MTRAETPAPERPVIGWREYVDLPDWGLHRIKAKADTGARTSAIDVTGVEELPGGMVRFTVIGDREHPDRRTTVEAKVVRRTRVKSSFGEAHERLFVMTTIRIGEVAFEAELGIVGRKQMLCRMLLGRKLLEGHFVVDPGRRYVRSRIKRRTRRTDASRGDGPAQGGPERT